MPHCLGRLLGGVLLGSFVTMESPAQDRYAAERKAMLEEIARDTWDTRRETGRPQLSERVMQAMARVPRHRLVPAGEEANAYRNRPLSIGQGQTISQPFIVALMTDLLDVQPGERVLEIGTGSGYQAAVLAELGANVYTIEIVEPLGREAAKRLSELGYTNIVTRIGDGYRGWPEHAPFDAIIVTAAAPDVPAGAPRTTEDRRKARDPDRVAVGYTDALRRAEGRRRQARAAGVLAVRFVPMTGGHAS